MKIGTRILALAGLGVALAVVGVAVGWSELDSSPSTGGRPPALVPEVDVPPAVSSDWRLTVTGAHFSGTTTTLVLIVEPLGPSPAVEVRVSGDQFGESTIRPSGGRPGIALAVGVETPVRMAPLPSDRRPNIEFRALDLVNESGEVSRVTGLWRVELPVPQGLTESLALRDFAGGAEAVESGITVRPVKAIASTSETLVTVEIVSETAVSDLMLPSLAVEGEELRGTRVGASTDGRRVTFSFPPLNGATEFDVLFDSFMLPASEGTAGFIDIDLAQAMARQSLEGKFGEQGAVGPTDVLRRSGTTPEVLGFSFARSSGNDVPNLLAIEIAGAFHNPGTLSLVASDGSELPLSGSTVYSGSVELGVAGRTSARFDIGQLAISDLSHIRLIVGPPTEVVSGGWSVSFHLKR